MKQSLKIILQRPSIEVGKFREIYRNVIEIDDSAKIDFQLLISSFRILYPFNDLIINFVILWKKN